MNNHRHLHAVLNRLYVIRDHAAISKRFKSYVQGAIDDQLRGIDDADEQIWNARQRGIRNPDFEGDEIGRPDDD